MAIHQGELQHTDLVFGLVPNRLKPVETAAYRRVGNSAAGRLARMSGPLIIDRKGIRTAMWCRDCHKEVDVKAAGTAGATCPLCSRPLVASTRQTDDIRRAYEILERWQSSDLFERISTTAPLTTLKQQDRAPLLNIPLGKPRSAPAAVAAVSAPADVTLTASSTSGESERQTRRAARVERTAMPWEALSLPLPVSSTLPGPPNTARSVRSLATTATASSSQSEQVLWDQYVSPRPLLATAAPELEAVPTAAVEVPPALLSGVSEKRPPAERPRESMTNVMLDQVMADAASTGRSEIFDESESAGAEEDSGRYDRPRFAQRTPVEDSWAESSEPYDGEADRSAASVLSSQYDRSQIAHSDEDSAEADATGAKARLVESAGSGAVETLPFLRPSSQEFAGDLVASLEILHSAPSLPMSPASIRVESATEQVNCTDSPNDINPRTADATKKTQRAALRRSPLQRRFQPERPVSESSAGPDTVTRKLRLDQTGADAENSQAKEPVTSLPSSTAPETKIVSNSPRPGRRFRVDGAESLDSVTGTDGRRARTRGLPKRRYIDEAQETQLRGPHFEVSTPRRTNLTSMTGQFLAYLGVLGLTVGTAMVIYGHFGGYSEYTPTGWLVTTVAQMLLFLGVINLVSGGIEQNNEDVSRRINTIGEQLLRIEQVTSNAMKGPKLPAHLYADDAEAQHATTRETVTVHRS